MLRSTAWAGLAAFAWSVTGGCGNPGKEQSTPAQYAQAIRWFIRALRGAMPQRDYLRMLTAVDRLERLLEELPRMLERNRAGLARADERKQHAEQARQFLLAGLNYDDGETTARLDQLNRLIDRVESPRRSGTTRP